MLDVSDPKQRERLLVVLAGFVLLFIVLWQIPAHTNTIKRLQHSRNDWLQKIEEHERHSRNKDVIQRRLTAFENQSLAAVNTLPGGEAESGYRFWLNDLATDVGLNVSATAPPITTVGVRGPHGYSKYTFTITGEGRLDQIAEFLRRFYRTEYLHTIQQMQPQPVQNQPGRFRVTFRIEALSLPQVNSVNMPDTKNIGADAEETRMLTAIRDRAILSEYSPPNPEPAESRIESAPFDDIAFCFLDAIVESDGKPQCWINHRTTGRKYYLEEGQSFELAGQQCTIQKIDMDNRRILVEIAGTLYSLRPGENFDQIEPEMLPANDNDRTP